MAQTVLITGASTGIGKATALFFHHNGWNVVATMRDPDSVQTKDDWFPSGERFLPLSLDVTQPDSIERALQVSLSRYESVECIVNNAGYGLVGVFESTSPSDIEKQFHTNVFGTMNLIRALLPHYRQRGQGTIINISSVGGQVTFPYYSCYHSTKWAVEGFSESLQFELRPLNIKVKLIEPGPIKTDFYDRSMTVANDSSLTEYQALFQQTFPKMQNSGERAPGPELVAQTIYQAATDKSWKMRYPVNASQLLWLRKLVPEWVFRKIISKVLMGR